MESCSIREEAVLSPIGVGKLDEKSQPVPDLDVCIIQATSKLFKLHEWGSCMIFLVGLLDRS